jgi:hypothetical protein
LRVASSTRGKKGQDVKVDPVKGKIDEKLKGNKGATIPRLREGENRDPRRSDSHPVDPLSPVDQFAESAEDGLRSSFDSMFLPLQVVGLETPTHTHVNKKREKKQKMVVGRPVPL